MKTNTAILNPSDISRYGINGRFPFVCELLDFEAAGIPHTIFVVDRTWEVPGHIEIKVCELWTGPTDQMDNFRHTDAPLDENMFGCKLIRVFAKDGWFDGTPYRELAQTKESHPEAVTAIISKLRDDYKDVVIYNIPKKLTGHITPASFFKGTKFRVSELSLDRSMGSSRTYCDEDGTPRVFTARYITRNGPNSWYVVTEDFDHSLNLEIGFNITHVTEIVSQPKRRVRGGVPKEITRSAFYDDRYRWGSRSMQMNQFIERVTRPGQVVDIDRMSVDLADQSFFVADPKHMWTHPGTGVRECFRYTASAKRIKRWVKQNINRYLRNPAKAQEELDGIYAALDDREIELDLRDDDRSSAVLDGEPIDYDHDLSDLDY